MNADTPAKRYSAINIGSPWRGLNVVPDVTIPDGERYAVMYLYSGITASPPVVAILLTLTDASNLPIPNLTGLRWAWWDQPIVNSQASPSVTGTGASTDASGVFSVTVLTGSMLSPGGIGWIEVTNSDGTVTQSPVANIAAGPLKTH